MCFSLSKTLDGSNFFNTLNNVPAAFGKTQAVLSKEALAEKTAATAGGNLELSSRGNNSSGGSKSS